MHMLCVRPEISDFVIGSSCDYSFIPEMCPSGNVDVIRDSDEYLVVELQPRRHEAAFLRPGPLQPRQLAASLNEWTTPVHRENARQTLLFHAGESAGCSKKCIAEADAFVAAVENLLDDKPRPYRGHPYWYGAWRRITMKRGIGSTKTSGAMPCGLPAADHWITKWLLQRAKYALIGTPPHVLPWHPDWPDFKVVLEELKPFFTDNSQRLLLLSNEPTALSLALADNGERVYRLRCMPFLKMPVERYAALKGKIDICLVELAGNRSEVRRRTHRSPRTADEGGGLVS